MTTTYTYNEQNRLISTVTHNGGQTEKETYDYDNNGNLVSKVKESTKPVDAGIVGSFKFYQMGTDTAKEAAEYRYDVWNQLTSTIEGDSKAHYSYNGEGLRVEKTVNDKVQRYLYEADQVVLEVDGSNNQIAKNTYGTNLLSREAGGQELYYMYNGHGDVTALIDAAGNTAATYYYDAFGNHTETTGEADNPYRYAGYQYDEETDLYYLNARYYDSKIARFMTEDTYMGEANDPLSLNLYTYCANNPIMYDDPTGHSFVDRDNGRQEKTKELKEKYKKADSKEKAKIVKEIAKVNNKSEKAVKASIKNDTKMEVKAKAAVTKAKVEAKVTEAKQKVETKVASISKSTNDIAAKAKEVAKDFGKGTVASLDNNIAFGLGQSKKGEIEGDSTAFKVGKLSADVASAVGGAATAVAGVGGNAGGLALDASIAGAPAGVAVHAISTEAVIAGSAVAINSVKNFGKDVNALLAEGAGNDKSYSNIPDSPSVGPGKKFTKTQKDKIIQENINRNDGVVKSDLSGKELIKPQKSQSGVKPDPNEWQIDHIDPRSKGGSNSNSNAQVLSREENRNKWYK